MIDNALNNDELTASELKIRNQIESRAKILKVDVGNKDYRDQLVDSYKFTEHLNACWLMSDGFDDRFISKNEKEFKLNNIKSTVMKIKLIKQLETAPFSFEQKEISPALEATVKKLFRVSKIDIRLLYKSLIPGVFGKRKRVMVKGVRQGVYSINNDVALTHLKLLVKRNKLNNVSDEILTMFEMKRPTVRRMV